MPGSGCCISLPEADLVTPRMTGHPALDCLFP
uniref:Uncharacterized protein n=1 Tax=Trichinella nativa TaxID=6335 RepID=A0A0V1KI76_9BILA